MTDIKYRQYLFSGAITKDDFISQLLFEYYKWYKMEQAERKTVRQFIQNPEGEGSADYKRINNNLSRIIRRNEKDIMRLGLSPSPYTTYILNKTSTGKGFFPGNQISKYEIMAAENCARNTTGLRIITLFEHGAISSSKKCKNDEVNSAYIELCEKMRQYSKSDDNTWLEKLFDTFHMEEQMFMMRTYQLAQYMQQHSIKELPEERAAMLFAFAPGLGSRMMEPNFVYHSHKLFATMFADNKEYQQEYCRFANILHVRGILLGELENNTLLKEITNQVDLSLVVTYLKEHYDLFNMMGLSRKKGVDKQIIPLIRRITRLFFKDKAEKKDLPL